MEHKEFFPHKRWFKLNCVSPGSIIDALLPFLFPFLFHVLSPFNHVFLSFSTLKTCWLVSLFLCRYALYYITNIHPVFGFRFHHGQTICSTNNNNKWWHPQLNNITSLWQTTNQLKDGGHFLCKISMLVDDSKAFFTLVKQHFPFKCFP